MENEAPFPEAFEPLFKPYRYKIYYGGRGGAKSWNFARALLIQGTEHKKPIRVLCTREIQKSIKDSVHKLLSEQVEALGLGSFYRIQEESIRGANGTEFVFKGLKQNIDNLKSFEGADKCWVEEAHIVSKKSWDKLIPTIRKDRSEIWISFNPELETDETYKRFVLHPPPGSLVRKVTYEDNPFFPKVLREEMEDLRLKSPDDFANIYEGICKQVVEGAIYKSELIAAEKESRICRVPYDQNQARADVLGSWGLGT
jgi:phage terminase large subunit